MKKYTLSLSLFIAFFFTAITGWSQNYYVYVTAESDDQVALIEFDGKNARVKETIMVGKWPAENEGPHGINVSPDGKYWYLSMAHGLPYGTLYKYSTETNKVVGETTLGLFPATLQVSKATGLLYCVNFNLHGDMVPSSVSVVDPEDMIEITKITTGVMPHGSRLSPDGTKQYSVAMMSGELFEVDALGLKVSRTLILDGEMEDMPSDDHAEHANMDHSNMDHGDMDHGDMGGMKHSATKPTWVMPHPDGEMAYIAGNGSNEILEIDLDSWTITRKFPCGKGPYNLDVSPDGKTLVVSYKSEGKTGIWDIKKGKEKARIENTRKVTHGVTISPDSKFAFVSVEGIGGEPGSVDVFDLNSNEMVSSVEVGKQAGGIIFWKME